MQKVNILIVEDEVLVAEQLSLMLTEMGYDVPAIYSSGTDLLTGFKKGIADLILMDINLANNTNGIETCKILAKTSNIPIIYLTQNKDENERRKAIFETNAVYFLHKPFTVTDISTAIDMTLKFLKKGSLTHNVSNDTSYLLDDHIFIKCEYAYKKIKLDDILFLKADGSYCDLKCSDSKFTFSENLSYFEDKLQFAKHLIRVHRSYIINVNHIVKMSEGRIWVGKDEIPVGKTFRPTLLDRFRVL